MEVLWNMGKTGIRNKHIEPKYVTPEMLFQLRRNEYVFPYFPFLVTKGNLSVIGTYWRFIIVPLTSNLLIYVNKKAESIKHVT